MFNPSSRSISPTTFMSSANSSLPCSVIAKPQPPQHFVFRQSLDGRTRVQDVKLGIRAHVVGDLLLNVTSVPYSTGWDRSWLA